MSRRPDGTCRCDRCGVGVGNGGVRQAAVISDVDPEDPRIPRFLHLCRAPRDGAPTGCVGYVLGPGTLADYTETRNP